MRAEMEAPAASAQHNVLGVCSGSSPLAGKPSAGCVINEREHLTGANHPPGETDL